MPHDRLYTVHNLNWRGIRCRVTHRRNHINDGWSHLTLRVTAPGAPPLPLTETGYISHFVDEDAVMAAGGPAAFFRCWLEREATNPRYLAWLARWRQLDLFP